MRLPCPLDGDRRIGGGGEVVHVNPSSEEAVTWSQRYKANLEKLGSRDLAKVIEVIRDLEARDLQRGLSGGEKRMLAKARDLFRDLSSDA
jgi:RNA polymerase-interacting CarD/CdnL/TRCF family regulator